MDDDAAELCVLALLFSDGNDFENVIFRDHKLKGRASRRLDRETLWSGGLQSLAHMALFRDWELSLMVDREIPPEDVALLSERVRQLTRWKLNFLLTTVDSRFWDLMQSLATDASLISPHSIPEFLDGVKGLKEAWGFPQTPVLTAHV